MATTVSKPVANISFHLELSLQRQKKKKKKSGKNTKLSRFIKMTKTSARKRVIVGPFILSYSIFFRIMTLLQSRLSSFPAIISHWPLIYQVTLSERFLLPLHLQRNLREGQGSTQFLLIYSPFEGFYQVSPKQIQIIAVTSNNNK